MFFICFTTVCYDIYFQIQDGERAESTTSDIESRRYGQWTDAQMDGNGIEW
jgi:hypothetical protein